MFGISFTEFVLILVVALVVLGPQRLPGMLRSIGLWIHKLRQMTTEVRAQTGIDDLLRQEGFSGGLSELRSFLRGDPRALIRPFDAAPAAEATQDPYGDVGLVDRTREQPVEGPDARGALPDDLLDPPSAAQPLTAHVASVDAAPEADGAERSPDVATSTRLRGADAAPEADGAQRSPDVATSVPPHAAVNSDVASTGPAIVEPAEPRLGRP